MQYQFFTSSKGENMQTPEIFKKCNQQDLDRVTGNSMCKVQSIASEIGGK